MRQHKIHLRWKMGPRHAGYDRLSRETSKILPFTQTIPSTSGFLIPWLNLWWSQVSYTHYLLNLEFICWSAPQPKKNVLTWTSCQSVHPQNLLTIPWSPFTTLFLLSFDWFIIISPVHLLILFILMSLQHTYASTLDEFSIYSYWYCTLLGKKSTQQDWLLSLWTNGYKP